MSWQMPYLELLDVNSTKEVNPLKGKKCLVRYNSFVEVMKYFVVDK